MLMPPEAEEQGESSHDTTVYQVTWDTQQDFFTVEFLDSSPTQVGVYVQSIINGAFHEQNSPYKKKIHFIWVSST